MTTEWDAALDDLRERGARWAAQDEAVDVVIQYLDRVR